MSVGYLDNVLIMQSKTFVQTKAYLNGENIFKLFVGKIYILKIDRSYVYT